MFPDDSGYPSRPEKKPLLYTNSGILCTGLNEFSGCTLKEKVKILAILEEDLYKISFEAEWNSREQL